MQFWLNQQWTRTDPKIPRDYLVCLMPKLITTKMSNQKTIHISHYITKAITTYVPGKWIVNKALWYSTFLVKDKTTQGDEMWWGIMGSKISLTWIRIFIHQIIFIPNGSKAIFWKGRKKLFSRISQAALSKHTT